MKWLASSLALLVILGFSSSISAAPAPTPLVGKKAPALNANQWFNAKKSITWDKLKGHVILVERWATW